jgi:hypothetical protein
MRFHGLDPRTAILRWGLFAVGVGTVLGGTGPSGVRALALAWETNRSSVPWIVERTFGFLAYGALTGSVVFGLLLSTKVLDSIAHRPITFILHQDLASIGVGLAGVHGMLLALDRTVPFSLAQVAVPGLAPHAPMWVALGQVAFYLAALVVGSFYVRRRIGQRAWRMVHYATFAAFVAATVHGLGAGTDTAAGWARWIYIGATVAVIFLFGYRVTASIGKRVSQADTTGASPPRRWPDTQPRTPSALPRRGEAGQ